MLRRHVICSLFCWLIASAPALAAELVITKSTVIGLEPGMVIDGGQEISLRKGHKLSLISPTGKTINLTGPYKGVPDPSAKNPGASKLATALANLVSGQQRDSSQLGAIRDAASNQRADPFLIDITADGDQCVVAGKPIVLWAPGGAPIKSLWIARAGSDDAAKVSWPADAANSPWPKSLPVVDGAQYEMLRRPAKEEAILKLHVIKTATSNKAELAIVMQEKNCLSQAYALIQGN